MGPDEEQAMIAPLFFEGVLRGEEAVYIVDPEKRPSHEQRLGAGYRSSGLNSRCSSRQSATRNREIAPAPPRLASIVT